MLIKMRILVILIWIQVAYSKPCEIGQHTCQCSETQIGFQVDCQNNKIYNVPDGIPTQTTVLYLSNNPIADPTIPKLPNLRILHLANTYTQQIEYKHFSRLPRLEQLLLQGSTIKTIDPLSFINNTKLNRVALNGNPLRCSCEHLALVEWAKAREPRLNLQQAMCVGKNEARFTFNQVKKTLDCADYRSPYREYAWGEWSEWRPCTGERTSALRVRECESEHRDLCPGPGRQEKPCDQFCPEQFHETELNYFRWPTTLAGNVVKLRCSRDPSEFRRRKRQVDPTAEPVLFVSRRCRERTVVDPETGRQTTVAKWSRAWYEDCSRDGPPDVSEDLDNILHRLNTSKNLAQAAEELMDLTEDAEQLSATDIDRCLSIIDRIRISDTNRETEGDLISSMSNLLSANESVLAEGEEDSQISSRIVEEIHTLTQTVTAKVRLEYTNENLIILALNKNQAGNKGLRVPLVTEIEEGQVITATVQIPKSVLDSSTSSNAQFAVYRNTKVFKAIQKVDQLLNSKVVIATLGGTEVKNLVEEKVVLTFREESESETGNLCAFWHERKGEWSTDGCQRVDSGEDGITRCECDHLTNFALLFDVYGTTGGGNDIHHNILTILTYVGLTISLLGLIITMLAYIILRKELLKERSAKILMFICFCLAMTYGIFLGMGFYAVDDIFCKVIACAMHFFLLSSFTWTLVAAFHMYQSLILVFQRYFRKFLLKASIFAWGIPLITVGVTMGVDVDNYGLQKSICWLRPIPFYGAFVGVIALIIVVNLIVFLLVVAEIRRMTKRQAKIQANSKQNPWGKVRALATIFANLGLTWIIGFLYFGPDASVVVQYLFVIFVTTQGLVIFLLYCVAKKDVRRKLLCCGYAGLSSSSSKKSSKDTKSTSGGGKWYSKARKFSNTTSTSKTEQKETAFTSPDPNALILNNNTQSDDSKTDDDNNVKSEIPVAVEINGQVSNDGWESPAVGSLGIDKIDDIQQEEAMTPENAADLEAVVAEFPDEYEEKNSNNNSPMTERAAMTSDDDLSLGSSENLNQKDPQKDLDEIHVVLNESPESQEKVLTLQNDPIDIIPNDDSVDGELDIPPLFPLPDNDEHKENEIIVEDDVVAKEDDDEVNDPEEIAVTFEDIPITEEVPEDVTPEEVDESTFDDITGPAPDLAKEVREVEDTAPSDIQEKHPESLAETNDKLTDNTHEQTDDMDEADDTNELPHPINDQRNEQATEEIGKDNEQSELHESPKEGKPEKPSFVLRAAEQGPGPKKLRVMWPPEKPPEDDPADEIVNDHSRPTSRYVDSRGFKRPI